MIRAVVVARHSRLEWTEFPRAGDDSQNQKTQLQRPKHVRTWSRCCQRDQRHDRTGGFAFGGLNCECLRAGFNTTRVEREADGERERKTVWGKKWRRRNLSTRGGKKTGVATKRREGMYAVGFLVCFVCVQEWVSKPNGKTGWRNVGRSWDAYSVCKRNEPAEQPSGGKAQRCCFFNSSRDRSGGTRRSKTERASLHRTRNRNSFVSPANTHT